MQCWTAICKHSAQYYLPPRFEVKHGDHLHSLEEKSPEEGSSESTFSHSGVDMFSFLFAADDKLQKSEAAFVNISPKHTAAPPVQKQES